MMNEMDYMMEDKVENDRKSNYKRDMYAPLSPEDPVYGSLFVDQVLMRFGIDPNEPSNQLAMRWHDIVGEEVAKHVFFEKVDGDAVHIACDNPSRASYMKINGNDVIKKIKTVFPELEVKRIQVRVVPTRRY